MYAYCRWTVKVLRPRESFILYILGGGGGGGEQIYQPSPEVIFEKGVAPGSRQWSLLKHVYKKHDFQVTVKAHGPLVEKSKNVVRTL